MLIFLYVWSIMSVKADLLPLEKINVQNRRRASEEFTRAATGRGPVRGVPGAVTRHGAVCQVPAAGCRKADGTAASTFGAGPVQNVRPREGEGGVAVLRWLPGKGQRRKSAAEGEKQAAGTLYFLRWLFFGGALSRLQSKDERQHRGIAGKAEDAGPVPRLRSPGADGGSYGATSCSRRAEGGELLPGVLPEDDGRVRSRLAEALAGSGREIGGGWLEVCLHRRSAGSRGKFILRPQESGLPFPGAATRPRERGARDADGQPHEEAHDQERISCSDWGDLATRR